MDKQRKVIYRLLVYLVPHSLALSLTELKREWFMVHRFGSVVSNKAYRVNFQYIR